MASLELNLTLDQRNPLPLYEQICRQLRNKIEQGQLRPGTKLPTTQQLRDRLQINGNTAQRAMASLAKEGYVVRKSRSGTVVKGIPLRGVVGIFSYVSLLDNREHEFYRLITSHLNQQLDELGRVHRMYLGGESPDSSNTAGEDLLRHMSSGGLVGVVLVNSPHQQMEQLIQLSRKMHIPIVALSGYADVDYSVRIDFPGYVRNAVQFLRGQGRKRIGVIYNRSSPSFRDSGLIPQILQECGVETDPSRIIGRVETEQGGYDAASDLPLGELDGLVVEDDIMATGVDRRLGDMGIRVPKDLLVTALWNHGSRLHLTRVFELFELNLSEQVRIGLQLLNNAISGQRIRNPHIKLIPEHQLLCANRKNRPHSAILSGSTS